MSGIVEDCGGCALWIDQQRAGFDTAAGNESSGAWHNVYFDADCGQVIKHPCESSLHSINSGHGAP